MTIEIHGMKMRDCGIGISVPKGSNIDLKITNVDAERVEKFLEERDPPSLVQILGLSEQTPPQVLLAVLLALKAECEISLETVERSARKFDLFKWVSFGADSSSVVQAIYNLATSPSLQAVMVMLAGLAVPGIR